MAEATVEKPEEGALAPEGKIILTAEQEAVLRAQKAQADFVVLQRKKCDAVAAEIDALLAKHGCEIIIGHTIKVIPKQAP